MSWKVLISSSHTQSRLDRYEKLLREHDIEVDTISRPQFVPEADLLPIVEPYDAIVCSDDEITEAVMDKAKNLKVISKWGVGLNSIDLQAAKKRGIAVYNSPGAFSESCALMIFAYILHFARGVVQRDEAIRAGKWEHIPGFALSGKTMGIIGMGNIGKAVAKRAVAFGMNVCANDVVAPDPDVIKELNVRMTTKEDVLRSSDFVIMACDLNESSFHLMSTAEFALMKESAYFFNTARGPVVDEKALVEALEKGRLKGAGIDVYEVEPLPTDSPLRRMDNVILTPHDAYNTVEAAEYVHDNTIKNLIEGLKKASQGT